MTSHEGHSNPLRAVESNSEVLLWQSRYRLGVVALIGASGFLLRMIGALGSGAVGMHTLGDSGTFATLLLLVGAYAAIVGGVMVWARRTHHAGPFVIGLTIAADLILIFSTVYLVTPPESYERALLLSFFTLQLTQLNFGIRAALATLIGIVAGYLGLLAAAITDGAAIAWVEELWTLYLFTLGSAIFVRLYGNLRTRLDRIAGLFERAQEGDFAQAYDVSADDQPDGITTVGRAYNRMRTQLYTLVLTDPLSGCLNRRGFEQQLVREVARGARSGSDIALIAMDIDHFKSINDTFGHVAGDAAIRECGALLRATARLNDIVARTGGEEFMLLAPETDLDGATRLAERIVAAFRNADFKCVGAKRRITVSIGVVAENAIDADIAEGLRARADEALYAAKRGGRDRVCVWTQGLRAVAGVS
jgi:diguanylate cyclase (GGDEF)-like protein